ncbi:MAG: hypothetical protein O3A00_11385 [Planctomycetota bacterium]|nr:hypothetical protein [Planctomycetota bacterium]
MSKLHVQTRARFVAIVLILVYAADAQSLLAQEAKAPQIPSPVNELLTTRDGAQVSLTYYASNEGKNASVLVLCHSDKLGRVFWDKTGIAKRLQARGFAVAAVDFRGFGENKDKEGQNPTMTKALALFIARNDMDAVKAFLMEQHHAQKLNIRKLGIVAPGFSASLACEFAAYDWQKVPFDDDATLAGRTPRGQDVQAISFLSPEDNPGLPGAPSLRALRRLGLAFQVFVGTENRTAVRNSSSYLASIGVSRRKDDEPDPRVDYRPIKSKAQGLELFLNKNAKVEQLITAFMEINLKEAKIQWIPRKSRLVEDN